MASEGDSLDGAAGLPPVEDLEEKQEEQEPKWSNLPPTVFRRLTSQSSETVVHIARQVCPVWLDNMEHVVGLRVKVDDNLEGNVEFVQSVKVVQARIVNWRSTEPILTSPNNLKKLTLSGTMPPGWTVKGLDQFQNLQHVVIRGAALHAQDMTGSPLPPPSRGASAMNLDINYIFDHYEPPIESSPIWLKRLTKLEVIINEFSYPSVLPLSVRLNNPERAMEHEENLKRLYLVVLNNVTFFLNNIRSPHLHSCQFYVYPKAGMMAPAKLNWKHKPLQRFLSNHKKTLKELYLPDFEGKHDDTDVDNLISLPTKLRKLQITLSRYIGDPEEGREQDSAYWKKVLMDQTHLVDVYMILTDLPSDWITDSLGSLGFSSKEFLTYVDIVIDHSDETVLVNLEIFTYCRKLEVLKISGRDSEIMIRNFCKLPSSMKKIYANMAMVELPEPQLLRKYTALEMLEIKTVAIGGAGIDQEHIQARTLELIQSLLTLRSISMISISFDHPLNPIQNAMKILRRLDNYFNPAYEQFALRLNVHYEMEAGWSEDVFDEDRLQIEYINGREPEDYNAYHGRHRNAISVDDEDHRIFVFQTLPFLVHLTGGERGRGRGRRRHRDNNDDDDDDNDADDDDDDDDDDDESNDDWEPPVDEENPRDANVDDEERPRSRSRRDEDNEGPRTINDDPMAVLYDLDNL